MRSEKIFSGLLQFRIKQKNTLPHETCGRVCSYYIRISP